MSEDKVQESAACWLPFVQAFVTAYEDGERLSSGHSLRNKQSVCPSGLPLTFNLHKESLVVLCSPHPDDEMLTGVLPLRLLREHGVRVVNLALTLGSNEARQAERWSELLAACAVVGFECLRLCQPLGFDLKAGDKGEGWQTVVEGLADFFAQRKPELVFFPHAHDVHPVHIATNRLVSAALAMWTASCQATVKAVETEYWSSMSTPNLLVGVSSEDLARLLAALFCHRGEIARNPYHLTHPARLMDTVRRGVELVKSTALKRPGFVFGELYRLSVWRDGKSRMPTISECWLGPYQGLENIFADNLDSSKPALSGD